MSEQAPNPDRSTWVHPYTSAGPNGSLRSFEPLCRKCSWVGRPERTREAAAETAAKHAAEQHGEGRA